MADMMTSWPPAGVSEVDLAFLKQLPLGLGEESDPKVIQETIEGKLRARADVEAGDPEAYKQALQSLAQEHSTLRGYIEQYKKNNYFLKDPDNSDRHFLWLGQAPNPTHWRIYLTPVASTAPLLLASLYERLTKASVPKVGMKLSTHDAVRSLRDGLVIYTNDAGKQAALDVIAAEARAHTKYFSKQLVRFTRPVADGAAGLAPDPQSQAEEWITQASSWYEDYKEWIDEQNLGWKRDADSSEDVPTFRGLETGMSYTQLVAAALTTCYLLARASQGSKGPVPARKVAMKSRTGGTSRLAAGAAQAAYREDVAAAAYRENVASAFSQLGINPSIPSLAKPTVEGVGWLRYQFFVPKG